MRGTLPAVLLLLLSITTVLAGSKREIVPGPTAILEEEKSIQPNPSVGLEHAIVLAEETELNENLANFNKLSYHLRAKILSNEGRDLANVEIPYNIKGAKLKEWWGRTLLPDGTVIELGKDDLEEQQIAAARGMEYKVLKGALPGVAPGCVIDYGYALVTSEFMSGTRVPIQRAWPVREFYYRWKPWGQFGASTLLLRAEGLDINMTREKNSIVIVGKNVPHVVKEPNMPPYDEVRASLTLYYLFGQIRKPDAWWDFRAKAYERGTKSFLKKKRPLRDAIALMQMPEDGDLPTKLQRAYDWIGRNIENKALRTAEDREADAGDEEDERNTAAYVLEAKSGNSWQLDRLFIGFARFLGAQAHMVLAADRTERYWHRELMVGGQFHAGLVAVQIPGQEGYTVADPGSGLPYGEVPWWLTGVDAMLATDKGASPIQIKPSDVRNNISKSEAKLAFAQDNESILVSWSRTGTGQCGYRERRSLRRKAPDKRQERLYRLCGESSDFEIDTAEAPDLDNPVAGFKLSCEGDLYLTETLEGVTDYTFHFGGPWIDSFPELTESTREHAIVFDYPTAHQTEIEITAPEGFAPKQAPTPVELKTPYGQYSLFVQQTENGFRIRRMLTLLTFAMRSDRYAELAGFLKDVRRADDTPVEFKRTGGF